MRARVYVAPSAPKRAQLAERARIYIGGGLISLGSVTLYQRVYSAPYSTAAAAHEKAPPAF